MSPSLAPIQAKIDQLKTAGAAEIAPDAFQRLVADFQHAAAALAAAKADGRITIGEAIELAQDAMTLASDIASLVGQLFPSPAPAA